MLAADQLIDLPRAAPARVLALGAYLKNTACRIDGRHALLSAHHGDLGTPEACVALEATAERLLALGPIDAIAHDLHPDFHSTRLALALAARLRVPAIGVQHHHAHLAVVQAEHGLDEPLVGWALDGVGLGSDGRAWGGEALWLDGARWRRLAHLEPIALPGGDIAAREPWRMAAAVLHRLGRVDEILPRFGPAVGEAAARTIATMLSRGINTPRTTSTGRWFDAMAGLLGLSVRQADEAEAAIALERAASSSLQPPPPLPSDGTRGEAEPDGLPLAGLVADALFHAERGGPTAVAEAALQFHLGLADRLSAWCRRAARAQGAQVVALGGGCFFNRLLSQRVEAGLTHLRVLRPQATSCGDAGLALGQAWAAALHLAAGPAASPLLELSPCA